MRQSKRRKQFDDILRTFINETNKLDNSDEKKNVAFKKLVLESQPNYRFRGATMSCSELLVALEHIIIDKVVTVSTARNRKIDTSAPMESGVGAKDDGDSPREEGDQRIVGLALQAVYKGTSKGKWSFGKVSELERRRVPSWQRWQRLGEPMAEGQSRESWQGRSQSMLDVW